MKTVILSGGGGTRLFPLSRESFPKQFIRLRNDRSFLQQTYERARLVSTEIAVATRKEYRFLVASDLGHETKLILEPALRNTAAAILYAIRYAQEKFGWDGKEIFAFLPADHHIDPVEAFVEDMKKAKELALKDRIVVLGIPPKEASTGFGYIKQGEKLPPGFEVERFIEKPSKEKAEAMLKEGGYFWNSGIYVSRGTIMLEELIRCSPEFAPFANMALDELTHRYQEMPSLPIDRAVSEKSRRMAMVPASFLWMDMGSWDAVSEYMPKDRAGNSLITREHVLIETKNSTVIAKDTIPIMIGVEDLIVVEDRDVLLIARRGESQKVKEAVDILKKRGLREAVQHTRVYRPWGYYEELLKGERFKVKKIHVLPGKRMSLQMHHHRSEHWVVVKGTAKITVGEKEHFLHENESIFVPKSTPHRIENVGKIPLEIVEIQTGEYVEEDDIIRIEDDWNRS